MIRIYIVFACAAVLLSGCKSASKIASSKQPVALKNDASRAMLDSMQRHAFQFEWFTAKAKVTFISGADQAEFTANIRMRRDSAIWVSVSPLLGIEVARVLLTNDSIRIIDRINNEYYSRDYRYFNQYTSLPVNYDVMQRLIAGSALFTNERQFKIDQSDSAYFLKWENDLQSNSITLGRNFRTLSQTITDSAEATVSILQQQYEIPDTSPFSLWRKIELIRPQQATIIITFSKIKVNQPVKLPFNVKE